MFIFSSLIVQAVELAQFPFISLQLCRRWWSWMELWLGIGLVQNSLCCEQFWSLDFKHKCSDISCNFHRSLDFWSLLCTPVFFPFHIYCYSAFMTKMLLITFSMVFSLFLEHSKKVSLSLSCLIPTFTFPPIYTQLIGESRTENSWSPNIAGIQQAQEKHLTRCPCWAW